MHDMSAADTQPTPELNLDAVRGLRTLLLTDPEATQTEAGVAFASLVRHLIDWMELAQAELTTLREQYILVMNERNAADDAYTAIEERAEAAEAELAAVREQLTQIMYYATHQRWCQFNNSGDQQLCNCGFRTVYLAAVVDAAQEEQGDATQVSQ
jgi:hypothetical protein